MTHGVGSKRSAPSHRLSDFDEIGATLMSSSIGDDIPGEQGGRISRNGYQYQDLCALRYSIRAAEGGIWQEVWCESHDDIVLYAARDSNEHHRFVQVKYRTEPGYHWTPARLAEHPTGKTIEASVLCKLFCKDIFAGVSDFRLATNVDGSADLISLTYRWRRHEKTADNSSAEAQGLVQRLEAWEPVNGKTTVDHVTRFAIERHAADPDDMEAAVGRELAVFLADNACALLPDELENVFRFLYLEVYRAASADLNQEGHPERVVGRTFREVALREGDRVRQRTDTSANTPPSETLRQQLTAIGADQGVIRNAIDLRQRFFTEWRSTKGTELGHRIDAALADIQALCAHESLRLRRDGTTLLADVLAAATHLHGQSDLQQRGLSLGIIHGMCYFIIGRGGLVLAERS